MRSGVHGQVDQQREVLPGAKADRIAIRGEQCRVTQTAEIPSRLHKDRIVRGFQIMRPDKLSVNSATELLAKVPECDRSGLTYPVVYRAMLQACGLRIQ